ncbi:hypothetical protein J437_LFUL003452 [Ladona fulva]|uniref:ATP-dependent RNA helicase n=1 Tax=Ladona fulva TaxID=123851 RepID=A0A8K0NVW1_LADFU|nr:hypothetical protein J437_LFUL003452 [Ladona fulva]
MLEAGHFQELKDLLERINKEGAGRRQNFVYSATLSLVHEVPKRIRGKIRRRQTPGQKLHSLAELIGLKDPKIVDVTPEGATAGGLVETRLTSSSLIDRDVRLASLLTYLAHSPFSAGSASASRTIVFCNSVGGVRRLGGLLTALQLSPYLLHAGMQQRQRLRSLERFSRGGILLATDVAARGLDLPLVDHVVHFQVPRTSETYVHRSGRTARANREGLSVLLVEPKEVPLYERLCRTLGKVNLVKERVRLAREVDFVEHQLRRSNAEGNWIQKTMKDADIILDEEEIPKKYNLDNPQLKKELKVKKKKLEALLRKTLLPMGFSPRYPTMNGKLEIPKIGAEVKTVDAVKSKLVEREKKKGSKWKRKQNS